MAKRLTAAICIFVVLLASPAFAYKRDVPKRVEREETTTEEPKQEEAKEEDYTYGSHGGGLVTAGYILIAAGGAAAIAGSTIVAATDKYVAGAIVGGCGAALGLTGTMFILFGERSEYAVSPAVDPAHGIYGLAFSGNF